MLTPYGFSEFKFGIVITDDGFTYLICSSYTLVIWLVFFLITTLWIDDCWSSKSSSFGCYEFNPSQFELHSCTDSYSYTCIWRIDLILILSLILSSLSYSCRSFIEIRLGISISETSIFYFFASLWIMRLIIFKFNWY